MPSAGELEAADSTLGAAVDLLGAFGLRIEALGNIDAADLIFDDAPTLEQIGLLFAMYDRFRSNARALNACIEGVLGEGLGALAVVREDALLHRMADDEPKEDSCP